MNIGNVTHPVTFSDLTIDPQKIDLLEIDPMFLDPVTNTVEEAANTVVPTHWTVFAHYRKGGRYAIADLANERDAMSAAHILESLFGIQAVIGPRQRTFRYVKVNELEDGSCETVPMSTEEFSFYTIYRKQPDGRIMAFLDIDKDTPQQYLRESVQLLNKAVEQPI